MLTARNIADALLAECRSSGGRVATCANIRDAVSRYECIEPAIPFLAFDASKIYAPVSAIGEILDAFLMAVQVSTRSVGIDFDGSFTRAVDAFRNHFGAHGSGILHSRYCLLRMDVITESAERVRHSFQEAK